MKIFLLIIFLSSLLFAQSGSITGKVTGSPLNQNLNGTIIKLFNENNIQVANTLSDSIGNYKLDYELTGVKNNRNIPTDYVLSNAYPNPFQSRGQILNFTTPSSDIFNINIYNILGQRLFTKQIELNAGNYRFGISGLGSAGIYFLTISNSKFNKTDKLIQLDGVYSHPQVRIFSGSTAKINKSLTSQLRLEFSKNGFYTKDTLVTALENQIVNMSLDEMQVTKTALRNGVVKNANGKPVKGIPLNFYKESNDSLLATAITDSNGNYSVNFNYHGYSEDVNDEFNNIETEKAVISKNGYYEKDSVYNFTKDKTLDLTIANIPFDVDLYVHLYKFDLTPVTDIDTFKIKYPDGYLASIPVDSNTIHLQRTLTSFNADTTAEFIYDYGDKYQKWLVGLDNVRDHLGWLFQNPSKDSTAKIPLGQVNGLHDIQGYMLKTWVKYQNQSGTASDSTKTDSILFAGRWKNFKTSGFRESPSGYNPVEVLLYTHNTPVSRLDDAEAIIDSVLNGLQSPQKSLISYNFHRGDETTDSYIQNIVSAPRSKDNTAVFVFDPNAGNGNIQYIATDGSYRIHDTNASGTYSASTPTYGTEFMESVTNTVGDNTQFYWNGNAYQYSLSELGRNKLGVSYIFRAGTNINQ